MITIISRFICDLPGCPKEHSCQFNAVKNAGEAKDHYNSAIEFSTNEKGWIVWRDFNSKTTMCFCCEAHYSEFRKARR